MAQKQFVSLLVCGFVSDTVTANCVGVRVRAADLALNSTKALHWSCPDCTRGDIDFHKLFMVTKGDFFQLDKEFTA